jgi:hypothetical protein
MRPGRFTILILIAAVGCRDDAAGPDQNVPIREIHYDLKTGELEGEKNFEFNEKRQLVREAYTEAKRPQYGNETIYEYDNLGNLVKVKARPLGAPRFNVTEYTYDNGRIITKVDYYGDGQDYSREQLYYNGDDLADSSVYVSWDGLPLPDRQKTIYTYDNEGHLTFKTIIYSDGGRQEIDYTYNNGKLVSTCYRYGSGTNFSGCELNEYDRDGHLSKIITSEGSRSRITEERFYSAGVLVEKLLYYYSTPYSWEEYGWALSEGGKRIKYKY